MRTLRVRARFQLQIPFWAGWEPAKNGGFPALFGQFGLTVKRQIVFLTHYSIRMPTVMVEERGGLGYTNSVSYDVPSCGRDPIRNCIGRDSASGDVGEDGVD
jgi:hypothetical protein